MTVERLGPWHRIGGLDSDLLIAPPNRGKTAALQRFVETLLESNERSSEGFSEHNDDTIEDPAS